MALMERHEMTSEEFFAWQESLNEPLPPEESLGRFFDEIGIGGFIVNVDGHWDSLDSRDLDKEVRRSSTGIYRLPQRLRVEIGDRRKFNAFAVIPEYDLNGVRYIMASAVYRDGTMYVICDVERPGEYIEQKEFTLQQLRDLGINKPQGWRGLIVQLKRLFR